MIPEVDVVATEVKGNVLIAHTATELDTPMIDATSFMADLRTQLMWPNPLFLHILNLRVHVSSQGAYSHLKESFLCPANMRSTFISLKQLNLSKDMRKCTKLATLEEWLLASPGMKPAEGITGGELHVFRQSSKTKKVHPSSSSRVHAELITSCPRIDEEDNNVHEDKGGGKESLEAESRSRKPGRKVKFRRPEADIIVFYSPEGTYEEIDQKQSLPRV